MDFDLDRVKAFLNKFIVENSVRPSDDYFVWNSSVYALLDCVLSAQSRYSSVVLPLLKERLPMFLQDTAQLTFGEFLASVDARGEDKFERYAVEVFKNRQKIAGRLKVEICYECAEFFRAKGFEKLADFHAASSEKLELLILLELVQKIRGIGPTLARYLLILLGQEDHVRPDSLLLRLFARETGWIPQMGHAQDVERVRQIVKDLAAQMNTSPARLDNALWLYESTRKV